MITKTRVTKKAKAVPAPSSRRSRIRLADIPRPSIQHSLDPEVKLLFRTAPRCLHHLVNHSTLFARTRFEPGNVQILPGGANAVAYFMRHGDWSVVVKLDYRTMRAEAEALAAWRDRGAQVVEILGTGQIPLDIGSRHSVRYVVLEGITGPEGGPAPSAMQLLKESPHRTKAIGRAAGRELALMHGATTKRSFGEFADMKGANTVPYGSFNTYLMRYLRQYEQLLADLGYGETRFRQLKRHLRQTRFPKTGRYIHGDPSPRNILVRALKPLNIVLIDPNPIIGHPTWDLAIIANNAEIASRKSKLRPRNGTYRAEAYLREEYRDGVDEGYAGTTRRRLRRRHSQLVRLVHLIMLTDIAIYTARNEGRDLAEDATVRAHREYLADLMSLVLAPPDAT